MSFPPTSTEFGLPLNLEDIAANAEFDPNGELARSLTMVDASPPTPLQFDQPASHRLSFIPRPSLFQADSELSAPPLPQFGRLARTSFRSTRKLSSLLRDIEHSFETESIAATRVNSFSWNCTVTRLLAVTEFEVRVFQVPAAASSEHLVEIRHMKGCRYSFSNVASTVGDKLGATFDTCKRSSSTAFPATNMLPPPSLRRSDKALSGTAEVSPEAAKATLQHVGQLLAPGNSSEVLCAGIRAVGAVADATEPLSGFTEHLPWISALAPRILDLARAPEDNVSEEVRVVAMTAAASLADRRVGSAEWGLAAADVAIEGVGESADGCPGLVLPHVVREALHLSESLLKSGDSSSRVREVLSAADGYVETTERIAEGSTGAQFNDASAQRYAKGVLFCFA